ncbi:MAG: hypothetical protein K2O34_01995 [Acetatifactor sp.]|nr:hypothetical protein [Acetatifactor sp.]
MFLVVNNDSYSIVGIYDNVMDAEKSYEECCYQSADWEAVSDSGDHESGESAFMAGYYGACIEVLDSEQWDEASPLDELIEKYLKDNLQQIMESPYMRAYREGNSKFDWKEGMRGLTTWDLVCYVSIIYCLRERRFYEEETGLPNYEAIKWTIYDCINQNRYRLLYKLEEQMTWQMEPVESNTVTSLRSFIERKRKS